MANDNKDGFERRLAVVSDIIHSFGLEHTDIAPVGRKEWGSPYNNYVYVVTLSSPAFAKHFAAGTRQPVTDLPPERGISKVVVRLSNPRTSGMNNTNRIQNEVAAIRIARDALATLGPSRADLVPAVYAWKPAVGLPNPVDEASFGWIVMTSLAGSPLNVPFKSFDLPRKKSVVRDIAAIFSTLQAAKLPPGVDRFGGMTIDGQGNIVSGQPSMPDTPAGPWSDYHGICRHQLVSQLEAADASEVIAGWRANGLRERIDHFGDVVLRTVLQDAGFDLSKLNFIHVDFTTSNMLYDAEEKRISGLIDFDFAAASHPVEEYLFASLTDIYGSAAFQPSEKLARAISTGDFAASTDAGEEGRAEAWELAKTWHEAVGERGGIRLSDIRGIQTRQKLETFLDLICPYHLRGPAKTDDEKAVEKAAKERADKEQAIDSMLREWGA